jgi:DNA-binding response OmpR family regulator
VTQGEFIEFGEYRLEPASLRLWRGGESVPLTPKVAQTLLYLAQNSNRVKSNDLGETRNLAAQFPERVKAMAAALERIKAGGH